jgi:hypothetical protein
VGVRGRVRGGRHRRALRGAHHEGCPDPLMVIAYANGGLSWLSTPSESTSR